MNKRRMNKLFAMLMLATVRFLHWRMIRWQKKHSNVADYRINEATQGLRDAEKALRHLDADKQYPEWEAASKELAGFWD